MKHTIATIIILFGSFWGFSQEVNLEPNWKKGAKKSILIKSETKKSRKEGKWEIESNEFNANLLVKEVNKDHYIIKITYKDFFLNTFKHAMDKIGNSPTVQKKLNLFFKVSKNGKEFELINWEDAKAVMNTTFNDLKNALNKKSNNDTLFTQLFNPFSALFTKSTVQSMFSTEMEALLSPYNTSWSKDTVKQTRSELNPFGKGKKDSLTVHTNSWIKDQNGTILNLGSEQIFDTEKFEEMMKTMMKTMFNGFMKMAPDTTSSKFTEKKKELDLLLDNMSFNIERNYSISYDQKKGFVKKFRNDRKMNGSLMGRPIKTISWSEVSFD